MEEAGCGAGCSAGCGVLAEFKGSFGDWLLMLSLVDWTEKAKFPQSSVGRVLRCRCFLKNLRNFSMSETAKLTINRCCIATSAQPLEKRI